ncbi:MAG: hypothetical protein WBG08_10025 [Litorimonas sp.]
MRHTRLILGTTALSLLWASGTAMAGSGPLPPSYVPDLEPPNPVAGECYARVEIPARYETITENVLTREAHKRLSVQQPRLESRTERVMVKEPSVRFEVRQPTYGTVREQVMTRPAYEKLSVSEPTFQTVTETVQRGQSRLVWKRGNPAKLRAQGYIIHSTADAGRGGKGYSSTTHYGETGGQRCLDDCVIWCLVEQPGESVTVTRDVMTRPGQVHRTPVPPAFETITKQVVTDPGGVRKVPIPAEYRNVHVQVLTDAGGASHVEVPAQYGQVQGRRLVSEARYEWRRVVCKPSSPQVSHHPMPSGTTQYRPVQTTHAQTHSPFAGRTVTIHRPTVHTTTRTTLSSGALAGGQTSYSVAPSHGVVLGGAPVHHGTLHHGAVTSGLPVPRSTDHPNAAYSGPAYAHPPTGASHPYAVYPGAAQRTRR